MSTLERVDDVSAYPTPVGRVSESQKLSSCFHLMGRVEDQLRFADSKAAFLATIHTLLVGPLVYNVAVLRNAIHHWDLASRAVLLGLGGIYSVLFLASMWLVATAVLPRFNRTKRAASRMFFGQIAKEFGDEPSRFVTYLSSMSERDWIDELGVYVVDASRIAAVKHRQVRQATVLTVASVVAWCAVVIALLGLSGSVG